MQRFHPLVRQWFLSRFAAPTALQEEAWEAAATGCHLLLTAPTGSGKTLAAFLWALNRLLTRDLEGGTTRILYISPLKALNSDVRENLLVPLKEIEALFRNAGEPCPAIRVLTRSGDTPQSDRQKMLRRPPEVLITTPESLNLLLATTRGTAALGSVAVVVLDEIHALAADKRGAHLMSALERLEALAGPFQRIALSATVRPLERIAAFAAGFRTGGTEPVPRPVRILQDTHPRRHQLTVTMPETTGSIWPDLTARLKAIIRANRSTLIFTNSRRLAERLARLLNEGEETILAWAHHGSLSREIRRAVEERLKAGELRAIVATSSLELGIDIGALDTVVLVQTPPGTAATLQRLGRSNHRVGGESRGVLFPLHGMDLLAATAAALAAEENSIEEIHPVNAPLDVLAQVLLAMGLTATVDLADAFTLLTRSWSFHRLSRGDFDRVVAMLAGRYADTPLAELKPRIHLDRIAGTFRTRPEARLLLYAGGGTIPDRGYYTLRTAGTGQKIGELDEEFVWERRVGDNFTLGSRVWRIDAITHNEVTVQPAGQGTGMVPFWKADDPDRGFLLSEKIGLLLEQADAALTAGRREEALAGCRPLDDTGREHLLLFLEEQRERCGGLLPHRHRIVAEHFSDPLDTTGNHQLVLHTGWGSGCNRPLALALAAAWEHKTGIGITFWANNDCLLLLAPGPVRPDELFSLLTPALLAEQMRSTLEKSGLFGAVFRECAGRALLLPKKSFRQRQPLWLNRMRARRLLEAVSGYGDFPVIQECWRECLQERFDLPVLARLLEEVQEGLITLAEAWTTTPSPFAAEVLWRQTNVRMYQDDTPQAGGPARLAADLVARAAADSRLRPRIPAAAVALLESRLQRTAPGYAPVSADDLLSHVRERLMIEETDWETLCAALPGPASDPFPPERLAWFTPPGGRPHLIALENLPRLEAAFGLVPFTAALTPFPQGTALSRERLAALLAPLEHTRRGTVAAVVFHYLEGKALVNLAALTSRLGIEPEPLLGLLQELSAAGRIVLDHITTDASGPEAVTTANLETLLRLTRRLRRPDFTPLPAARLPLFLAAWQGLTARDGDGKTLPARLDQLLGWPAPAALWEEAILPARLAAYRTAWLDNLAQTSGLAWRGCGREKVTLLFPDEAGLFFPESGPEAQARAAALFPAERGRFSLLELAGPGGESAALAATLWELAWTGAVGNDSFAALRQGCRTRFHAAPVKEPRGDSFSRWQGSRPLAGNWHRWPPAAEPDDPFAAEMLRRERVRQLLSRYGLLCRELLNRELPALRWGALFRTLRLMELSGELRGGIFFENLSSPQFINHAGWRALRRERDQDAEWFVNAADPASAAGILPGLPARRPATWLVYRGEGLAAVAEKNGEALTLSPGVSPGVCRPLFETLLARDCRPRREIRLSTVNGEPVSDPGLEAALGESGFVKRGGVWELRRRY